MSDSGSGVDDDRDDVVLARIQRGGFGGRTRSSCVVAADGSFRCVSAGTEEVAGVLTSDQLALIAATIAGAGFGALPRFVDGPVSRSDGYTWTYRVRDHTVAMRDPDRAGAAVPSALRVIDALVAALESGALPAGEHPTEGARATTADTARTGSPDDERSDDERSDDERSDEIGGVW